MGEVYRATDTTLKRQVAIKVLPAALAADADRLARFQREAEVLASLNHPNIAHLYGIEEGSGEAGHRVRALVMELVEGPTLADRIAQGPMPVAEALSIAKQIAGALEAAHERGVIHRDLKPANVRVTPQGRVKVLDFGLARVAQPSEAGGSPSTLSQSPTLTSPAVTAYGVILGTAAYMSPEQARGRAVDARSDIWAFGAVLYEMLTGRRAFDPSRASGSSRAQSRDERESVSDTLAAILRDDPDWSRLPADLCSPPRAATRRLTLQRAVDGGDDETPVNTDGFHQHLSAWSADGQTLAFDSREGQTGSWDVWVSPLGAAAKGRPLFSTPATERGGVFSPNGQWIAYESTETGRSEIYVQAYPDGGRKRQISNDGGTEPAWSSNGGELFYRSGERMMSAEVDPAGLSAAPPRVLFQGVYERQPWGARNYDVSRDGQRFLMLKSRATGEPQRIVLVQHLDEELMRLLPGR